MVRDNAPDGDRERERLRYEIAKAWRCNGRTWTEAEMTAAIEAALQRAAERRAAAPPDPGPPQTTEPPAVQRSLFDADDTARRTRAEAQAAARPKNSRRCELVIGYVTRCGERGALRDEIAEALELPIQTVCPLVKELERRGQLVPTSRTRPTRSGKAATVLVAPQFADAAGGPTR